MKVRDRENQTALGKLASAGEETRPVANSDAGVDHQPPIGAGHDPDVGDQRDVPSRST